MIGKSCILWPEVNGKDSKLYKDLLDKIKRRPIVNLIYAYYISSPDIANKMVQAGYNNIDKLGQHSAKDLLKFIDFSKMQNDLGTIRDIEKYKGVKDQDGNVINFKIAKEALEKANEINTEYKGVRAYVVRHSTDNGYIYNVIVDERNGFTNTYNTDVTSRLKAWDVYKQVFNNIGIDIEKVPEELQGIFSAYDIDLVKRLMDLQKFARLNTLHKNEAWALFLIGEKSPQVQRLVKQFGSIEKAAQALDDYNGKIGTLTDPQKVLLMNAVNYCKAFHGIDLNALKAQIEQIKQQTITNTPEETIRITLHKLNKKYNINASEIHRLNREIRTLSDAAAEAIVNLERQIREVKKNSKDTKEEIRLTNILNKLVKEANAKKYYSGILDYLQNAASQVALIDPALNKIELQKTDLETAFKNAKTLYSIKRLREQYYGVISTLANKNLSVDESISKDDIDAFRQLASNIKDIFDKNDGKIKDLTKSTILHILQNTIGDETPDGSAIINAVDMYAQDSTALDRLLYSMSRATNPMVAVLGGIMNKAKVGRNDLINEFDTRITKATKKLFKAGYNTKFMYEDQEHIISDINWTLYNEALKIEKSRLSASGLKGFDFKLALEKWIENNTEDRVVDRKSGRTERIPNHNYRKAFPTLSDAQLEYYNTIMQIKGEIGTLLPEYAQHQYLPPQLRRNYFDALGESRGIKDILSATKNKLQNIYKTREDDTRYGSNGIIVDGSEHKVIESDYDDTPLRQIPIFYINKVENGELLKDFSGGLSALAGTAINYDAMSGIEDVVNFMGDYIKDKEPAESNQQVDKAGNKIVSVFKDLRDWSKKNANTEAMVNGFINQNMYGMYRNPKNSKAWNNFVDKIVAYTSFKNLSTNLKGMFANWAMGEFQMLIEAGAGEFYNFKDFGWANVALFGKNGVTGELWDILCETKNSKGKLLADMFDPEQENFDSKSHKRYHKGIRKVLAHDLSFIGYGIGENLIHYVGMYAILHHYKVKLNNKVISLFDAFEVVNKGDGAGELRLKKGVTMLDGSAVTNEYLSKIRDKVKYCNQSTHGAMNAEDKGLIYSYWLGRLAMNFRQWMVEHYSRRFRKTHYDATIGENREGWWYSAYKVLKEDFKDNKDEQGRLKAIFGYIKDVYTIAVRGTVQYSELTKAQRYNLKRVRAEFWLWITLCGLSQILGEPEDHKKDVWRRWWIYQVRRAKVDEESAMPLPQMFINLRTTLNSPMAGINTVNAVMYLIFGVGDINKTIKTGKHKGENKYLRNVKKYLIPFYNDYEQMSNLGDDDTIFKVFDNSPANH